MCALPQVSTLLSTKHANIVEVKEVYETEDYFIIVMDKFGEGSDLFDYIQNAERYGAGASAGAGAGSTCVCLLTITRVGQVAGE